MRYVHNKLVLRLQQAPDEKLLAAIHTHFADILLSGQFTVGSALPEEKDEPALAELPRLIFTFNRTHCGRLRQLIDCLNRGRVEK